LKIIQPEVSVILPFHQDETTLHDAIESIYNQHFELWELLLINNNADQTSEEIATYWQSKDERIHVLHEKNQGIAFALNAGLKSAHGNFIARMDADDISFPDRLSKQVSFLHNHPEIDVVASQTQFHSIIKKSLGYELYVQWQNKIITPEEHFLSRFVESPLAHPSVMFRKKLIEMYGTYSTGNVPEDYELWLRWMDNGVNFYKIPELLLQWKDHPQRLSRVQDNYSEMAFHRIKCHYLSKYIRKNTSHEKHIVICGNSSNCRKKATVLSETGINIYGYTDVKVPKNVGYSFISISEITEPEKWFIVNMITKRGVGDSIKQHFLPLGFREGKDFILAG
jgi:glycosyltransferase involved in cell wall biosynthesis